MKGRIEAFAQQVRSAGLLSALGRTGEFIGVKLQQRGFGGLPLAIVRRASAFTHTVRSRGLMAAVSRTGEFISIKLARRGPPSPAPIGATMPPPQVLIGAPPAPPAQAAPDPPPDPSETVWPKERTVISLLMPVYNTPADVLEAAIRSVLFQTDIGWELCICDDASTSLETLSVLKSWRGFDPRLKITRSEQNLNIAGATNRAAEFATGQFVGFLDHDDILTPDAVAEMIAAIEHDPEADVLYSDEDKIEADGRLSEPYFKPDWSPEHLDSVAYILHLMLVRKSLFLRLGGLRSDFDGAQDYDLSLRATGLARKVVHVPRVLYHWRKIAGSAAAVVDAKPTALINARAALRAAVEARVPGAKVAEGLHPGTHRVLWPVDPDRPVTLLILTGCRRRNVPGRGDILLVENAVNSILDRSAFQNKQLLVLDDGGMPAGVKSSMERRGVRVERYTLPSGPFNYPDKLNAGLDLVDTEDVVMLNDDIEVITPDWLEALLAHSRREKVGAVGARLLYPNDRIQHAGMVLGVNGETSHLFHNLPGNTPGYGAFTHVIRNYSAVTGAVMASRMSLVRQMGGYDPALAVDFNDTDFCLRLGQAGYRIVYTPFATLYHFEGSSLTRREVSKADLKTFQARWGERVGRDPYYNPNLPKDRLDCAVARW